MRSARRRVLMVIGVSLALATAALAFWYGGKYRWQWPWQRWGTSGAPGLGDVGPVVRLDPFRVTDWEGDGGHLVNVTFELELEDEAGRQAVTARNSRIRSEILTMLADFRQSTIGDASEYEAFKMQVRNRIQPLLPGHPIRRVLITQFFTK